MSGFEAILDAIDCLFTQYENNNDFPVAYRRSCIRVLELVTTVTMGVRQGDNQPPNANILQATHIGSFSEDVFAKVTTDLVTLLDLANSFTRVAWRQVISAIADTANAQNNSNNPSWDANDSAPSQRMPQSCQPTTTSSILSSLVPSLSDMFPAQPLPYLPPSLPFNDAPLTMPIDANLLFPFLNPSAVFGMHGKPFNHIGLEHAGLEQEPLGVDQGYAAALAAAQQESEEMDPPNPRRKRKKSPVVRQDSHTSDMTTQSSSSLQDVDADMKALGERLHGEERQRWFQEMDLIKTYAWKKMSRKYTVRDPSRVPARQMEYERHVNNSRDAQRIKEEVEGRVIRGRARREAMMVTEYVAPRVAQRRSRAKARHAPVERANGPDGILVLIPGKTHLVLEYLVSNSDEISNVALHFHQSDVQPVNGKVSTKREADGSVRVRVEFIVEHEPFNNGAHRNSFVPWDIHMTINGETVCIDSLPLCYVKTQQAVGRGLKKSFLRMIDDFCKCSRPCADHHFEIIHLVFDLSITSHG